MIAAGIALALAAAVGNAVAVVLQAAEDRQSPESEAMHLSLLARLAQRPQWLAGSGLMALAGVAQVSALSFAPIAVVQPMLSTSQLVLLGIARMRLHESVGRSELLGAVAIVLGLSAVVYAAPSRVAMTPTAGALAVPMGIVGGAAVVAYLIGRMRPSAALLLVIGAGLSYAFTDFVAKLLSDAVSAGNWPLAAGWVAVLIAGGAAAFLQETTALQVRPAVTVAPVVGSIKVPIPVLMALAAGLEHWQSAVRSAAILAAGLAFAAAGAATLGRSEAVSRVSGAESDGADSGGGDAAPKADGGQSPPVKLGQDAR